MSWTPITYGPVGRYDFKLAGRSLVGWAAPLKSPLPCLVGLFAGSEPISFCAAVRYSEQASDANARLGWCGFELPAVDHAVAIGGEIVVKCVVSGAVLKGGAPDASVFGTPLQLPRQISVRELLTELRSRESCPTASLLVPFAASHLRRHGTHSFLTATFHTLLERDPAPSDVDDWLQGRQGEKEIARLIATITESDEFASRGGVIPGPFQSRFKYDHDVFG